MRHTNRSLVAVMLLASLGLAACGKSGSQSEPAEPAKVEQVKGSNLTRIVLTPKAVQRVGIETSTVQARTTTGTAKTVIPYAAVLYDASGATFTYTSPAPRVYVRRPITVASIDGREALLKNGPAAGTTVVTVGAAELLGAEYGVEE
jgi:predicted small lipoprotein YifL